MQKHLPKLLWTLVAILGLYFLTFGFTAKTRVNTHSETTTSERSSGTKMQAGFDIRNLSHHLLDF